MPGKTLKESQAAELYRKEAMRTQDGVTGNTQRITFYLYAIGGKPHTQ